ncbi:hypothetical protein LTR85_005325 [Meristemomyces frigidus]|nr:hypothetical protein LTR85_005325 [Meristemomyces frigidus]
MKKYQLPSATPNAAYGPIQHSKILEVLGQLFPRPVTGIMDASPLVRLPAELRILIYELCLTQVDKTIHIQYHGGKLRMLLCDKRTDVLLGETPSHMLALLKTCRLAHEECSKIAYSSNVFRIVMEVQGEYNFAGLKRRIDEDIHVKGVEDTLQPLSTFISTIGTRNAAAIRSIIADYSYGLHLSDLRSTTLSSIMTGSLVALIKLDDEKPDWHLQASIWFWGGRDEQYMVNMHQAAERFEVIAEGLARELRGGRMTGYGEWVVREMMGHLTQWEQVAGVERGLSELSRLTSMITLR